MDRAEVKDIFALTPMQQGMLSHYLQSPGGDLYFEQLCLELAGRVERRLFAQAWQVVAEENEMLRTVFHWDKLKQPVQIVLKDHAVRLRYEAPQDADRLADGDRRQKFDLREVPFRVTLARIAENHYRMIITNHHILFDGWSSGIILSEFLRAYHALCRGETPPRSVKTRFREFVKYLKNLDVEAQRTFWRRYLDGLNTNREGSPVRQKTAESISTGNRRFKWDRDRVDRLETFLQTHRLTAAAFLNTAWGLLLQKYNGSRDVVFDTTVSGRSAKLKGIEEMVGLFINTLPLRVRSRPDEPILHVLNRVNSHLQEREAYEHTPLTVIHEYSAGAQQDLRFDSVVVLENYPLDDQLRQGSGPLAVTSHWIVEKTHHDVTLIITLYDGIEVSITYNERLWPGDRIEGLWHYFMKVVEQMLSQPERRAAAIAEPTGIERDHLVSVLSEEPGQPAYRAPRSELEKKLAVMWAEVLDVDQAAIGIDADFFLFGGHSLKVNLLLAQLHRQLDVRVPWAQVFKTPTIRGLAAYIGGAGKSRCRTIVPVESRQYYVSSSAQKRLYMIQQMAPDDTAYNGPLAMVLAGDLDSDRLEDACLQLVRSHESLRTSFVEIDGEPVQRVHDVIDFKIEKGYAPHPCLDSRLTAFVSGFVRPFDLAQAPLLRVGLIKLKGQKHLLMVDMHHIVSDGISRDVLMKELAALYTGRSMSPCPLQYKDFCHWQHRQLLSGELDGAAAFWQARFAEEPPVLNLPLDSPRPPSQQYRGARLTFHLEPELAAGLRQLATAADATLFMVVLTLLNILLSKYSGQEDIVVGTAIGGRYHADVQSVIGLLMETMALRNYPRADRGLAAFLQEVKETTLQAYANQEYPFRELLRRLAGESLLSRNQLFDVMLIVQNQERVELSLPGVSITPFAFDPGISKLDLTMEVFEGDEGIAFELEYSTALFKVETINRLWQHFVHIIEQAAAADGETVLSGIQLATPMEKRQILEEFNGALLDDGEEKKPVPLLWVEQVEKTAERVAVVGDSGLHISYRQLDVGAGGLAHGLRQRGCRADTIVALQAERTVAMMLGLLGILKAGAAYLPIDPAYPEERVHYMLSDSGAQILLTQRDLDRFAQSGRVLPADQVDGSNLAYVIYTSGSTGRPKGVLVSHGNLAAYLYTFWQEFAISEADVVVQQASFSFDTFGEEVYPVLLRGGKVAIPEKGEVQDVALLANFIARHSITLLDCSPLLLNELNRHHHQRIGSLRIVISGGDALKKEYISHLLDFARVYNTYGPTEATICSTYHPCQSDDPPAVPIGRPITNYRIYILDRQQNLLPIGVPGELCISGVGVSLGYLNNPQLTADRFLNLAAKGREGTRSPNHQPLTPKSQPLYRTGDLCRWLPDGRIEFLGRIDHQVKIRGFRIELEEIEKCLLNHEQVKEAVVLARDQKGRNTYLTAYIVPTPPTSKTSRTSRTNRTSRTSKTNRTSETSPAKLRQYLAESLPDYMVPAYFVFLETLPLTVSGKVDRKALPEPTEDALSRVREYAAPRTPAEEKLASIWQEILGLDPIGIEDNFFELGGDSILANRTIARMREETGLDISLRAFFESPCIRSLAEKMPVKESESHHLPTIPRTGKQENIPLSFSQERLWFLQQLDQESRAYHVPRALRIRGRLDITLFERTFTEIIRRHEILRTVFPTVNGRPTQRVKAPFAFKIPVFDWSGMTEEAQRRSLEAFIVEEGRREFDFEQGPMLRVTALRLKETEHIVISSEHHLVHDGWTQGIMLREFVEIFTAFSQGRPSPLAELPIQYADYALWQRRYMSGEQLRRHLDFWQEQLSGLPPLLELPTDYPRPAVISGSGDMQRLVIPAELAGRLEAFSKEHEVTLFMTMLTVFKVLLFRYSGLTDLCLGTGIANRRYREIEGMLGMVINTLPLRTQVDGSLSFLECLQEVRSTCLHAYEHEDTPFEKIVEQLQPERSLSYMPIFQVLYSFMDTPTGELLLPGLEIEVLPSHNRSSKFDLNIVVILPPEGEGREVGGEVLVDWEYNTDLFSHRTMAQMSGHYQRLLRQIVERPYPAVSTLPMLTDSEIELLLDEWNDTQKDYPTDKLIHEVLADRVALYPHHTALMETKPVRMLTYEVFNRQADRLADRLRERGVRPGSVVALEAERSLERLTDLFGILKAGGAYLPIDPGFPPERRRYILADSGAVVSGVSTRGTLATPATPTSQRGTANLAYVLYTSGSTGNPKGVAVEHSSVVNLLHGLFALYPVTEGDAYLLKTSFLFDVSVSELFGWFWGGARLVVLRPGAEKEPLAIIDTVAAARVTHLNFVPSMFAVFVECLSGKSVGKLSPLKYIFLAGEALDGQLVRRFRQLATTVALENLYGPTEGTVYASWYSLSRWSDRDAVPIGWPFQNVRLYVRDASYGLQPIGVPGELYIGGKGVARGYLNNPELTADKFLNLAVKAREGTRIPQNTKSQILNPKSYILTPKSQILYKTGDRVRWLGDGTIEFLGRIDHQIKIRGFRIELGEIESRLLGHPAIKEAVVIARPDNKGDKTIIAYFVPPPTSRTNRTNETSPAKLRQYLAESLPDYMIPSHFVRLAEIPTTNSGKVNRRALPELEVTITGSYAAPGDEVEKKLVQIWSQVLGIKPEFIGIDDNFFKLGGHSLKITELVLRVHQNFDVRIPFAAIFKAPTIRRLAIYIDQTVRERYVPIRPVEEREYYNLSASQKRLFILQQMAPQNTAYNISTVLELTGRLKPQRLEQTIGRLIERHESLRTSFPLLDTTPVQRIRKAVDFAVEDYDKSFIRPFDLSKAPLLRVGLTSTPSPEGRHIFILDMHHIVTDGISMGTLVREFVALYRGEPLSALRLQYRDYVLWQEREREQGALEEQQAYWLKALSGGIPVLNLPTDFVRPAIQSFSGSRFNFFLEKRQTEALKGLSQAGDATLFMTLLALFTILLSRLSGQEDIVVGTPIAGRRHADLQSIIGMFVNTLALRNYPVGDITFIDFLEELKGRTLTAFDNQEYPFEDLVERLNIERNTGRNPLFDVMFAFQDLQAFGADIDKIEIPGLTLTPLDFEIDTAKFDLNFIGFERNGRLFFSLEYCTALFKQETVERFVHYFKQVVSAVSGESAAKIGQIEIISDREKNRILYGFNNTRGGYVIDQCIHRLFEAAAAARPDHLGLVGTGLTHITYGMLNGQAYRLAQLLKSRRVEPQAIVAIKMRHSIDMIVGLLGILKVGALFLPIDPDYPEERVQYMLADSCARMLLTDLYPVWKTEPPPLQPGSQLNFLPVPANSLAYCIYTSGSSGRPKGVGIEHRSLVNLCRWHNRQFAVSHQDRATKYAGIGFDASVWEIFPYLAAGASLHIIDEDIRLDIDKLLRYFERQQITIAFLPTQICEQFMDFDCRGLRILLTGGDKLKKYAKRSYRLVNNYGPTENTVVTTSGPVDRDEANIPIGQPIMNSRVYILDRYHHVQPVGVPGELCIAGDGLARGYLNNPELTAERFVNAAAKTREDTRSPTHQILTPKSQPLYRTGDLSRFLPDGSLEFLGRLDQQVKVRGNRVELAEIESRLLGHPAIKEAVVTVRQDKGEDQYLAAYIIARTAVPDDSLSAELREYLSRTLPAYMIPAHFTFIDCIPLTANGKVDIRALPEPAPADGTPYAAPRDEIEEKLAEIWSELLAVERGSLGLDANFFHLGGHSLKATRLSAIIHRDFNVKIPLLKLFQVTTIRGLAQYIREAAESIYASIQPLERREYYAVSSAQKRMFILNQLKGEETSDNTPLMMMAEGDMDKARLEEAVRRLIQRHEPLRTSFAVVHDTPVQVIHPYAELEIRYGRVDSADIARLIRAFIRPFDLSRAPLFRLGLFQVSRQEHLLLSDMHHIIADGTSLRIFVDEFIELYNGGELPCLRIQYKDFTLWQNNLRHSDYIARQEAFWLGVFPEAEDIPTLSMPTDFPRPRVQSFEGQSIDFDLGTELSKQVQQFILKQGVTLYMFLLSAYAILLARCSEQEDIVVGTPIAGRPHADLQNLLGMFVNTLPIRLFPAPEKTFDGFLEEVKWRTLQAYENQDYQFEELVNRLGLEPDPARQTLFDTMFVVQNTEIGSLESRQQIKGLSFNSVAFEEEITQFDIITHAFERAGMVAFKLRYCTRLFKHDTIRRLIGYFREIITAAVDQPDIQLRDITLSHGLIDHRLNVFAGEEGDFNL